MMATEKNKKSAKSVRDGVWKKESEKSELASERDDDSMLISGFQRDHTVTK